MFAFTNHYIICCMLMCKVVGPVFSPHQVLEGARSQVWLGKLFWEARLPEAVREARLAELLFILFK